MTVGTVAADCRHGCACRLSPSAYRARRLSEPVGGCPVRTESRHGAQERHMARRGIGTGRTRPNGGNATAGGCGAFGANLSADYPNGAAIVRTESRRTVAAECRHGCHGGTVAEPLTVPNLSPSAAWWRTVAPVGRSGRRTRRPVAVGRSPRRTRHRSEPVGGMVSRRVKCPCKGGANGAADCPNPSAGLSPRRTGTPRERRGRSGRGRTRPNGGNARAGGCGAFGANQSA